MHLRFLTLCAAALVARSALAQDVDYARDVKPLFKQRCFACHAALKQQGQLRLDTGAAIRRGGESGPAIVPGDPENSLLIKVVSGRGDFRMPPEGEGAALSAEQVAILVRWIQQGATTPAQEEPETDPRAFWSYRPVARPQLPLVQRSEWVQTPVDAFIAAEHERRGLAPRPEADRALLLRRVYLDLIGLPPTPDELHAFLNDDSAGAYERVVDRLLESPQYGQRWGRHWMDVWRYSDWYGSRGINEIRYSQRHIWRWRDWIVESLNADRGYDQMVREMLAGDELAPGDENVIRATGFLGRNWYKFDRNVWMFETVEQTAQAFLGLTMRCARCHDHKFDPVSQADYYAFRAFFEPHDVRTDPLTGDLATEKDATLGPVLKTGVSLVYDKQLDVPTYVFARGDSRYPDESRRVAPGVPAAFGVPAPDVEPVVLPPDGWYPTLKPAVVAGLREEADQKVAAAEKEQREVQAAIAAAQQRLADIAAKEAAGEALPAPQFGSVLRETFDAPRPDVWKVASGTWEYANGRVTQSHVGPFPTMNSTVVPPRDFMARVRYRTLEAGSIHSVGVFFDAVELRDCQAVYSATNNKTATIQAFHRQGGVEQYPAAGIVPWPIQLGQELTVDIAARGQLLNVWVNGELAIAYTMPLPRQSGTFALWTHAGAAEFDELLIDPLPAGFRLAERAAEKLRSPFFAPTRADYEAAVAAEQQRAPLAAQRLRIAQAERAALDATLAAEAARRDLLAPAEVVSALLPLAAQQRAQQAAAAQRQVALLKAELEATAAADALQAAQAASYPNDEAKQKATTEAQKKRDAAQQAVAVAQQALQKTDAEFTSLGAAYPATSTGRRTALARWITDPRHPRTARFAVNHIWLRHFGEGLAPNPANFGLNGGQPSHPELLDWLAAEFVDHGWSMKHLHRILVTSSTYRQSTADGPDGARHRDLDPQNRWYWRMNSRRMEAEVVRDSVLYLAGRLDLTPGGPEIPETQGEQSPRRSLYFRSTPNEKMVFLELFDRANPNECYRRQESVVPQQALALSNSLLSMSQAQVIAAQLLEDARRQPAASPQALVRSAFERLLSRPPTSAELAACDRLLARYKADGAPGVAPTAVDLLVHVLLNHNDFVTIR